MLTRSTWFGQQIKGYKLIAVMVDRSESFTFCSGGLHLLASLLTIETY